MNNVIKDGTDYWNSLKAAEGKTILSSDEEAVINEVVMSLRTNPATAGEFKNGGLFEDIIFQFPVYWEFEGIPCKALIDIVRVDHALKTIRIKDIKTTGDHVLSFPRSIKRFRYDFQAAFYILGIRNARESLEALIGRDTSEYSIVGFEWVVESTKYPGMPLVFEAEQELIHIGKYGRECKFPAKDVFVPRVYGYIEAMTRYKWHLENGFDSPREVMEKKGKLSVDWFGIIERR